MQTYVVELGQDLLPDGAIQHGAGMGEIAEKERDVEHAGIWRKVRQRTGGHDGRLDSTQLQPLDDFTLTAQPRRGEMGKGELITCLGQHDLFEFLRRDAIVAVRGKGIADLDLCLCSSRAAERNNRAGNGRRKEREIGRAHV